MIYFAEVLQVAIDGFFGRSDALPTRVIYNALKRTLNDVSRFREWPHYLKTFYFRTLPSEDAAGTIDVSSSRTLVTLTTGTASTDWLGRVIRFDGTGPLFEIASVDKDNNTVTLAAEYPGDDITANAFVVYQVSVPLPSDFRMAADPVSDATFVPPSWATRDSIKRDMSLGFDSYGTPIRFALSSSRLYFSGLPTTGGDSYSVDYYAWPAWLQINQTSGTVALKSGETTILEAEGDCVFSSDMVGAYLILGNTNTEPDPVTGNDQAFEITEVDLVSSPNTITLASTPDAVPTGTKYRITSVFDLPDELFTLFQSWLSYDLSVWRNDEKGVIATGARLNEAKRDAHALTIRRHGRVNLQATGFDSVDVGLMEQER